MMKNRDLEIVPVTLRTVGGVVLGASSGLMRDGNPCPAMTWLMDELGGPQL